MPFKRYSLSRALAALLYIGAKPFYAIMVEVIMRNNSVKSFLIWASSSGGDVV